MFRSGNPTLKVFDRPQTIADFNAAQGQARTMTVQGTVNAAFILVGLCASSAIATWMVLTSSTSASLAIPLLLGGGLGGLILCLIISFSPRTAPYLSPIYALCKGVAVGAISLVVASQIGGASGPAVGIVFQAMLLTFGIFGGLLLAYTSGLVRVGSTMKRCMYSALIGLILFQTAAVLLTMVGVKVPFFWDMVAFGKPGLIGIAFSAGMLVLGSLFLVLDFQSIESGAKAGAPKYMEWYGAFSLLVTLVWLYIEALRLLSKLRSK